MTDGKPLDLALLDSILIENPPELWGAIGQLTVHDRPLYYALARDVYEGFGDIVDAGALIGASALILGAGLRANPRVQDKLGRIQVFDLFEDAADGPCAVQIRDMLQASGAKPKPGPLERMLELVRKPLDKLLGPERFDFLPLFEQQTAPVREHLRVFKGDITQQHPAGDRPVEILSIDVAKSPDLMLAVARNFFPALVPGRSRVVHQDYIFVFQPWLHIFMELMSDWFEKEFDTQFCSTVFKLVRPVSVADIERVVGRTGADYYKLANAHHIHRAIEHCDSRYGKIMLHGALAYFQFVQGHRNPAVQTFLRAMREFDVSGELVRMSELRQLINAQHLNIDYRGVAPA